MDRVFSLDIKSLDPDRRTFAGIASTPALDRQGHILDPAGITFTNPVPLLLHHDQKQPVGWVTLRAAADGIYFDAVVSSHAVPVTPVATTTGPPDPLARRTV